jgi:hypothetical protein
VVSRVFKFLGVSKALFIHPLVAGVGYLLMLRAPSIQPMTWLKVADNAHRLLSQRHDPAGTAGYTDAGRPVQGQAGGGLVLHASGRRHRARSSSSVSGSHSQCRLSRA